MTLLYKFQLFDEIPMVWGSLLLVYVLTTIIYPKLDNSILLIIGLIIYGIFVTTAYLVFIHPIIFQVSCINLLPSIYFHQFTSSIKYVGIWWFFLMELISLTVLRNHINESDYHMVRKLQYPISTKILCQIYLLILIVFFFFFANWISFHTG